MEKIIFLIENTKHKRKCILAFNKNAIVKEYKEKIKTLVIWSDDITYFRSVQIKEFFIDLISKLKDIRS